MKQTLQLITRLLTSRNHASLFFLPLIIALCPFALRAQSFIIGANNGSNTNMSYPTPFGDDRSSTRAQYLYRASELVDAGVSEGNIIKLGFFVESLNDAGLHDNYTIKLLLTSSVSLISGTWQDGAEILYGPVDYTPTLGLNEFALSAPFYWNGASNANLVVEICHYPPNPGPFASNNASVQWTTGLAFNGSRTRAQNNNSSICSTTANNEDGTPTSRPVLHLTFCYPPTALTLNNVTSTTATANWTAPAGGDPAGYDYTYGLEGYVPGSAGSALGGGSTTTPNATITGLNGITTYALWVRSDCGDGVSRWTGPLNFTTDPSCNDIFADPGGFAFPYSADTSVLKTLCPDIPDNALTISFFTPITIGSGDTLRIYNGNDTLSPLLAALTGVYDDPVPGPFTATSASGCLTFYFTSDETDEGNGWIAILSCAALEPDTCYPVLGLEVTNITFTGADMSWQEVFGAADYDWELVELPYVGSSSVIQSAMGYVGSSVNFNSLEAGTAYQFAIRSNCINNFSSDWDTLVFIIPVNCNGIEIQCASPAMFSAAKTGIWNSNECGSNSPGKERVFRFVAPHTRSYSFEVTNASGGFVNYFYKIASDDCNGDDWQCIGDFNVPGSSPFPPIPDATLTAGTLYYILADPQVTTNVSQTFRITDCGVPNDQPEDAIEIIVGSPCLSNVYSNIGATIDPNEPNPDADDSDGLVGRWLDAADETVWFKFQAPPSGTVTIFTDPFGTHQPNDDTQVALYRVGDPLDYSTYELLVSDEDNGNTYLGFNSVVSYTGLVDGDYYYIQVDGWGVNSGAFCISVLETVERVEEANCDVDFFVADVNEEKWYNIYATVNDLDIGPLVAAINPHGLNLDTVFCRALKYDEIPYLSPNFPYLPLYYNFSSSQSFTGNVTLRLFFTDAEFAALKDSANAPAATLSDLEVTRFNGDTSDCFMTNNAGAFHLIGGVNPVPMVGTFYLEFSTDSLGEFGARLDALALPLQLKSFGGKVESTYNLLEWITLTEQNVQWHIVERSLNGSTWVEVGRKPGQANSTEPLHYFLEDRLPPAKAYYRLRSMDFDGTVSMSQVILLTRRSEVFGITSAFPSPMSDGLTVQFNTQHEEDTVVRLTDIVGRVVLEQPFFSGKGINTVHLSVRNLPAGVFLVTVANDTAVSAPVRVVKQ
ncbi:MAG: T9SS type A sorting domain-containing protein [Saprospiraceae bacterium]|nr:T9SS type A sorting domain-containing protein [Saprospiraceae bacterium]